MNKKGKIKARNAKPLSWNYFDRLPPRIKQIFQNAPYPLQVSNVKKSLQYYGVEQYAKILENQIKEITKKSCAATYGQDHPQAK